MRSKNFQRCIVLVLSFLLGNFAWRVFSPAAPIEHFVGGPISAFTSVDSASRLIYLRGSLFLSQRPRHAWMELRARDRYDLFVNGESTGSGSQSGVALAKLVDLAPYLTTGRNVVAVRQESTTRGEPAKVELDGALDTGTEQRRWVESTEWRVAAQVERSSHYWFSSQFDDAHWPQVEPLDSAGFCGVVDVPPSSIKQASTGKWVSPLADTRQQSSLRREFSCWRKADAAWLRIITADSYQLAVNGQVLDRYEAPDSPLQLSTPVQRNVDVTPYLRRGSNVVALAASGHQGAPSVMIDGAIEVGAETKIDLSTNDHWLTTAGLPDDWFAAGSKQPSWTRAEPLPGELAGPSWMLKRQTVLVQSSLSMSTRVWTQWALSVVIAFIALRIITRRFVGRLVAMGKWTAETSSMAAHLSMLPACGLLGVAVLSEFDAAVVSQDVYCVSTLVAALLLTALSWWIAWSAWRDAIWIKSGVAQCDAFLKQIRNWRAQRSRTGIAASLATLIRNPVRTTLLFSVLIGFALRARGIPDPMSADEMSVYRTTHGFLERGFPSIEVHPDLPVSYVATSELVYVPSALTALVFSDPNYVVRVPSVLFGVATIVLLYVAGARLFSTSVGLVAAAIYALAPTCVQMSNFGRYFSQLQFFTLLTTFLFIRLILVRGDLNTRRLWTCAICFVATFLSWEASALLAPGMILAALWTRQRNLGSIFLNRNVWLAILVVGSVVILQDAHRSLQQSQRLVYGTGASEVSATLMTRYPGFEPLFYLWESSWARDAFFPAMAFLTAILVAARHGFARPTRILLIILFATTVLQSLLLPVKAWRYSYHLTSLTLLLAAVGIVAMARYVERATRLVLNGKSATWLPRTLSRAGLVVLVVLASGSAFNLADMPTFRVSGSGLSDLKFPDMRSPCEYLREHLREGDIVLASGPHVANEFLPRPTDYWPQSRLHLQAVLDDQRTLPLHRLAGTVMVPTLEELHDIFERHDRIWYLSVPTFDGKLNHDDVLQYVRDNMTVVREDFSSQLLFRGNEHRPAFLRQRDHKELTKAGIVVEPEEWW